MAPPPVTLDEFKAHLNLSGTSQDVELTAKLEAATDTVEQRVGAMVERAETERAWARTCVLILPRRPVVELTSVTRDAVAADLSAATTDLEMGVVRGTALEAGPYDVVYTVGAYADESAVPDDLKEATLIVGAQLWESQRGSTGTAPGVPGQALPATPRGFALPNRAMELMVPYLLPVVA